MALGFLAVGGAAAAYFVSTTLPQLQTMVQQSGGSMLYDLNGHPVTELGQNRIPVSLSIVPKNLQNAVVATEDARFWTNPGFDVRSIFRAAFVDLMHGGAPVQGASTITEQLGKNLFLSDRKSIGRKLKEFLLGLELEHIYTKQEILKMYLNQMYLGAGAFGVQAAARTYFGTNVQNLDLPQAALLAGLLQAPSAYDPFVNLSGAKARQKEVLGRMAHYGYITQAQAKVAYAAPLNLTSTNSASGSYPAPFFVDYVTQQLLKRYSAAQVFSGGLQVYTTLDPKAQAAADSAVATVMNRLPMPTLSTWTSARQAAMVVMDPKNGYILAMVGGRTHPVAMPENLALADFPTGSSIKPLAVYTPAIDTRKFTELSVLQDVPWMKKNGVPWPNNDDHLYRGYITLRHALAISDNNATVQLLHDIGINTGYNFATKKFGLPLVNHGTENDHTLALAIGGLTRGVSVLNMTDAFATFANQGVRPQPISILKVLNRNGAVIQQSTPSLTTEFSPQVNYIAIKMMEGVFGPCNPRPNYGCPTGSNLGLGRPAAGKTGTAGWKDGWFMGFTPQVVAGVWEGSPDQQLQPGVFGATYAGPIWKAFMEQYLKGQPALGFARPPGIVTVKSVDNKSGLLPGPYTPRQDIKSGDFIAGTQPTTIGSIHVQAQVWQGNQNLLWVPSCGGPPVTKVFLKRPSMLLPNLSAQTLSPQVMIQETQWLPTTNCAGQVVGTSPSGGGSSGGTPSGAGGSQGSGSLTETLTIQNGRFSPLSLSVAQGKALTIILRNTDLVPYTFNLSGLQITGLVLPPQTQVSININGAAAGTYPFTAGAATGQLTVQ